VNHQSGWIRKAGDGLTAFKVYRDLEKLIRQKGQQYNSLRCMHLREYNYEEQLFFLDLMTDLFEDMGMVETHINYAMRISDLSSWHRFREHRRQALLRTTMVGFEVDSRK
jgi:hypothetical protein